MNAALSPAQPTAEVAPPPPYGIRGAYQRQDADMTLREGLAEYYAVNPGLSVPATLSHEPSATFFHRHDCTHVVFGTHTGPSDEVLNDMLTLFGCDVGLVRYFREFSSTSETYTIAKMYADLSTLRLLWHSVRLTPIARRHCASMRKKWAWEVSDDALDRSLGDIREEYGIWVLYSHEALGIEV